MIRGRYLNSTRDCDEVFALRRRVFVEEMGLDEAWARDAGDDMAVYVLAYDEAGAPSGTGRLSIDQDRFMLGRVCVLEGARGSGLGDLIARMLLLRARELNAPRVYVNALTSAAPFYARYGFRPTDEPDEEGCVLMRAEADEIDLGSDCGGMEPE